MPVQTRSQFKINSMEMVELKLINKIFSGLTGNEIYYDIYQDFRNQAWITGNFDMDYCLLDKWVWKYRDYTVDQLRKKI